jgi:hypothetical protein
MKIPPLSSGSIWGFDSNGNRHSRGSIMGRPNILPDNCKEPLALTVTRLPWVDCDYDSEGAYWGFVAGDHIWRAVGESKYQLVEVFVRAKSVDSARLAIIDLLPHAHLTFDAATLGLDGLDPFTRAYIECALWLSDEEASSGDYAKTGLADIGFDQISPADLQEMIEDCQQFMQMHHDNLAAAYTRFSDYMPSSAGHDFYLTRNGHGVGFSDRNLGVLGDALYDAAHKFGERQLVRDSTDGKLYYE